MPVPEIVFVELDPVLGRSEPDYEIRSLIIGSGGRNLGLDYLPGSITFDPLAPPRPDSALASAIVWFDALLTNVDRTARNPNLLLWHRRLWMIDHGAALYFHHTWADYQARSRSPFPAIKDHVLLPFAGAIAEADVVLRPQLTPALLTAILAAIPDDWLGADSPVGGPESQRAAYLAYLLARLESASIFVEEAEHARAQLV